MYQILIDGRDLYYPQDEEYTASDPVVKLQLNDSGTLDLGVPVCNPEYDNIKNRISMVQVLKNGKEIFYGEVREAEKDFYRTKQVYAVGELAFLYDSIQPQAEYHDLTTRQMLETWLNIHNSQVEDKKKFYVGIVTVHDSNDSLYRFTNQETTLDAIREKLCEKLNGYLRIRKENGKRYLDLVTLEEYGKICEQPIEFGDNLLDYSENISASDLYTCVIPKGARLEESPIEGLEAYVDIKSVNDGKDYVYSPESVSVYGWNRCVVSWDDVTLPENLKKKAEAWLKDAQYETMVLNLTAADLSILDADMESFELGDSIHVYSRPHGMDRAFPVQTLELHLQDPSKDNLQLGTSMKLSYTDQNKGNYQAVEQELDNVRQTTSWMQSAIDNATAMMTGSKGGYKISEFDEDGRWLRDLYMNAPNKEDASKVMQINMNGIGFSRTGFEGPYLNAWTIDGVFLGEFIKANTVTAEKLSVEYRESVNEEIVSKFNVAKDLISAEVTRAQGVEVELAASLKVTSELVETKVSKGDFGSYVQQYYDKVIYGFNHSSRYVQINPGEIAIYDNGVEDSKLRSSFDQNGNHFYRDGYYIGKIGTNFQTNDRSKRGLVFDLESQAAYMTWAAKKSASSSGYTMVFTYTLDAMDDYSSDTLHAGCDLDMHNRWIRNAKISGSGIQYEDAGITATIDFVQVLEMNPDGTASRWGDSGRMQFKNGRLVDLNYYA
ncbi:phage minor structural protein [Lachnospiraceae bacterium M18-1]|nr:phage minor structural protein [Lachnospiraceae bacterium M18-1]